MVPNRRDAIASLLMALAAEGARASDASNGGKWTNGVFTLADAKRTPEPYGELAVFFDGKTDQLKSMNAGTVLLHPGQEPHPPHQHPEEEFVLVTEGTGEILVNGKTHQVESGALMYCGGNALHGIKNTGATPFRFYYFKWLGA